jgi:hypothetical protein
MKIEDGCPARLIFKTYMENNLVLSRLEGTHTHGFGDDHLKHLSAPPATVERVTEWVRLGLSDKQIVRYTFPSCRYATTCNVCLCVANLQLDKLTYDAFYLKADSTAITPMELVDL